MSFNWDWVKWLFKWIPTLMNKIGEIYVMKHELQKSKEKVDALTDLLTEKAQTEKYLKEEVSKLKTAQSKEFETLVRLVTENTVDFMYERYHIIPKTSNLTSALARRLGELPVGEPRAVPRPIANLLGKQ